MKKLILPFLLLIMLLVSSCQQDDLDQPRTTLKLEDNEIHLCTFDLVNSNLNDTDSIQSRAVLTRDSKWENGTTIRIKFLNGTTFLRNKVMQFASQWPTLANLKFVWVGSNEDADIKIGFEWNGDGGSWSYVGNYCKYIAQNQPSMNFGWFTEQTSDQEFSRTVIHEFGHALGLKHEHQHPLNNISWNKPVVYGEYAKQGWSKKDVDLNVFAKLSTSTTNYSAYDKYSIMHYGIDQRMTTNGYSVETNTQLSATDKSFISSQYPGIKTQDKLIPGQSLYPGQYIESQNKVFKLIMQGDGNLVLYKNNNQALWHTHTYGKTQIMRFVVQGDGNLVLYDAYNNYYWHSNTYNVGNGAELILQNDGNLVLYKGGAAKWHTYTYGN